MQLGFTFITMMVYLGVPIAFVVFVVRSFTAIVASARSMTEAAERTAAAVEELARRSDIVDAP